MREFVRRERYGVLLKLAKFHQRIGISLAPAREQVKNP